MPALTGPDLDGVQHMRGARKQRSQRGGVGSRVREAEGKGMMVYSLVDKKLSVQDGVWGSQGAAAFLSIL